MSNITIAVPEVAVLPLPGSGPITSAPQADAAQLVLRDIATRRKEIVAAFAPSKSAASNAHKEICALEKRALAPVDAARESTEQAVISWRTAEAQRVAREQAAAAAEAQRIADEQALARAEALEEEGAPDAVVDAVLEAPVPVAPAYVAPVAAAADGVTVRVTIRGQITDRAAALAWLVQHADECLDIRQGELDRLGRRSDGERAVPGVCWVREQSLAVRGR